MSEFLAALAPLATVTQSLLLQAAVVFLRVGGAFAVLPGFGESQLPLRIKIAGSLAVTLIVTPAVLGLPSAPLAPYGRLSGLTFSVFVSEALIGLIFGLSLRFLVFGLQTAGTLIAQSTSVAQMFNGTGPEPQPVIGNLLTMAGLALFCLSGGLSASVELLVLSYEALAPGLWPPSDALARWAVERSAFAFSLAFTLAAPFVIAALLYNLALGAINRAMPTLMVTLIGAPALTWGSLILLVLVAPLILAHWHSLMRAALITPMGGW